MSSFEPLHLVGPHRGTKACPICTYVDRPGVQVWTDASAKSLDRAFELAAEVERTKGSEAVAAFLVVVPSARVSDDSLIARAKDLRRTMVTRLATPSDPAIGFHRFTPGRGPMVLIYAKRRTVAVLSEPRDGDVAAGVATLLAPPASR